MLMKKPTTAAASINTYAGTRSLCHRSVVTAITANKTNVGTYGNTYRSSARFVTIGRSKNGTMVATRNNRFRAMPYKASSRTTGMTCRPRSMISFGMRLM